MQQHQVPETQREEYNSTLQQAYRHAQEVEPKLEMYLWLLKDPDMVRTLVAIVRLHPTSQHTAHFQIYTIREQHN
jgi:hypothetical protein